MRRSPSFDYIVIGAGSAGCVLAHRLTEDPSVRVLLLEAGGWDWDPWIRIPLGAGKIYQDHLHDWGYRVEPQAVLDNRAIDCARGKVIGGCSSINMLAFVRGNRGDYDRWASAGLREWSFRNVLPYFRKSESWEEGANEYRGGSGPITTRFARFEDPVAEAVLEAGTEMGHRRVHDYNAEEQEGFGRLQQSVRSGRRCSAALAYLRPALTRTNLTVCTNAHATRLVFHGRTARGVEYRHRRRLVSVFADREVIVSGGTINSPQLLMLSGLGDPQELSRHGIDVRVSLPGVGKNLQDHLAIGIDYLRRKPGPFVEGLRLDRILPSLVQAYCFGTGFASDLPAGCHGFVRSNSALDVPDIQMIFRFAPYAGVGVYLPPFKKAFADTFSIRSAMLHPESRGRIELRSTDPSMPVRIHQNFLQTDSDRATLRRGFRLARELGQQPSLQRLSPGEALPQMAVRSDQEIDAYVRQRASTSHHPVGTCRMGTDSDSLAVVDSELRVRGVDGLRIVDGSVLPDLPSGNTNAPIIMVAEKASDLIRGKHIIGHANLAGQERAAPPAVGA